MFVVLEIGLGIASGAWSASHLPHAGLIALIVIAPVIAWRDFSAHRIPEVITLPWLTFATTIAAFRLPGSITALITTAVTAAAVSIMIAKGIIDRKHLLGIADAIVLVAILATLSDNRTFPANIIFLTMALTVAASAPISIAVMLFKGKAISTQAPIGGSLAIAAVIVAIPTFLTQ